VKTLKANARLLIAGGVLVLTAACAGGVTHGTVTGKSYQASYTTWHRTAVHTTSCSHFRRPRTCHRVTTYHNVREYHPSCWRVYLRDSKGHTGSICVTSSRYQSLRTGDHI
jgi:hypothetical protein